MKKRQISPFVVLVTGPIGSGKSTVSSMLFKSLGLRPLALLPLDKMREFSSLDPRNRKTKDIFRKLIFSMTLVYVNKGVSVIIDSTLPPEFIDELRRSLRGIPIHSFLLGVSVKSAMKRIRARGSSTKRSKVDASNRFYLGNRAKGTIFIDTESSRPRETVMAIREHIQ